MPPADWLQILEGRMKAEKKQKGIGLGTGMIIGIAIIYILFGLAIDVYKRQASPFCMFSIVC